MSVICLFFHVHTVIARAPGPTSGGGSRKSRRKQKGRIQPGTDLSEQYRVLRETPTTKKISTTSQETIFSGCWRDWLEATSIRSSNQCRSVCTRKKSRHFLILRKPRNKLLRTRRGGPFGEHQDQHLLLWFWWRTENQRDKGGETQEEEQDKPSHHNPSRQHWSRGNTKSQSTKKASSKKGTKPALGSVFLLASNLNVFRLCHSYASMPAMHYNGFFTLPSL